MPDRELVQRLWDVPEEWWEIEGVEWVYHVGLDFLEEDVAEMEDGHQSELGLNLICLMDGEGPIWFCYGCASDR